ncbi:bifunctional phosphoglucose/phosphomannose isomerase [candidate division NPL-UPA2 bacterium Unc8]|uniref:Bifunctional phosphoglucose/phosphomannose isomerase n=1 Tax=candidate division NPL-UPA2 bacterium Unc8 TaxID=1980939 RepID=A0A399FUX4_UNCN2|nr:MAG: bifunctional phosphoglucose/phosphomannose isomerase [candidate division NPL-UPA2 bacterium Unc8]
MLMQIKETDSSDMLTILLNFPQQWEEARRIGKEFSPPDYKELKKIVITGLGGSAIGGDILRLYLNSELELPIFVNRDYTLPRFVDDTTLFMAVSYSGNTEETLSAYKHAKEVRAKIAAVSSGGTLSKLCHQDGFPVTTVPPGLPPRTALGYLFLPTLITLQKLGLVKDKQDEIEETLLLLRKLSSEYAPASSENQPYKLALKLKGKIPIVYQSEALGAVGLRWKTQINENSKILAYTVNFPEMNHNEIVGWERRNIAPMANFKPLILRDKGEDGRIVRRIDITKSIIGGEFEEIWSRGESLLARLFSLIYYGDFLSFYLAILAGVDPTPVKPIDTLKRELAKETPQ